MPRLTVLTDEKTFKENYKKYEKDPGAYRAPNDFCQKCWRNLDVELIAAVNHISVKFAQEQVDDLAEKEGLWDDFHPNYAECDYHCVQCGKLLEEDD